MKKLLLLAAMGLLTIAPQAGAVSFSKLDLSEGNVFQIKAVGHGDLYVNGNVTSGNFTLSSTPCDFVITKQADSENKFSFKAVDTQKYMGANIWNTVPLDTEFFWTLADMSGVSGTNATQVIVSFNQQITSYTGYLKADTYSANQPLYSNKSEAVAWEIIGPQVGGIDLPEYFESGTAELKAQAEALAPLVEHLTGEAMPVVTLDETATADNIAAKVEEANNTYRAYINKVDKKLVYVQNYRRQTNNQASWAAIYLNNAGSAVTNTLAEQTPDCIWQIIVNGQHFNLYNLTSGFAIDSNSITPETIANGLQLRTGSNGLNMDTSGNNLTHWTLGDPGNAWVLSFANYDFAVPEASTAEAPKYYRILSDRWMSALGAPALGVDGEDRAASGTGEFVVPKRLGQAGIYWRIEDAGDGKVKLVNLIDGYSAGKTSVVIYGTTKYRMSQQESADAEAFYLHNLNGITTNNGTAFTFNNSYAISSSNSYTANCLDSEEGYTRVNEWNPVTENRTNLNNNGSLWYFIAVSDAEISAVEAKYIAAIRTRLGINDLSESLGALVDEETFAEYAELIGQCNEATQTIAGVNETKRSGNLNETITRANQVAENTFKSGFSAQHVQLYTINPASNIPFRYLADNGTKLVTLPTQSGNDVATLWTITQGETGYIFTNEGTGRKITEATSQSQDFNTTDGEGSELLMTYDPLYGGFAIHKTGTTTSDKLCIHCQSNLEICSWSAAGVGNSNWRVSALPDAVAEVTTSGTANTVIVSLGSAVTDHAKSAGKTVTLTPYTETEPAILHAPAYENGTVTIPANDFDTDGNVSLTDITLPQGNYMMNVPAGMTVVDSKPNRATTYTFSVNNDGGITSIDEITEATEARPEAIFDLQGRRLAAPVKGINIINGKKVLVR